MKLVLLGSADHAHHIKKKDILKWCHLVKEVIGSTSTS